MLAVLFAAVGPFVLWPIEIIFPYPHVVEEIAKAILILFILQTPQRRLQGVITIFCGLAFALSESVLYLFNILLVGSMATFFTRLALTIPLHTGTFIIIWLFGLKTKKLLPVGVALAILIHFLFNCWIGTL